MPADSRREGGYCSHPRTQGIQGAGKGLTNSRGKLYTVAPGKNSRSYNYIRNHINALPLLEFCSRDATTVRIIYTYEEGNRELVVSSAYLPYDSDELPTSKEAKDIIHYCYSRKKQLIIGCDANAHHTLWGSTGVNPR
jgi:splicing factor 45